MTPRSRKATIGAAFGRAAPLYDRDAIVQRQAAQALAARIAGLALPPAPLLLEIGCGTGLLTRALQHALPDAQGLITDLSPAMVESCRAQRPGRHLYCAMDGEAPCVVGPHFDLICASLAFQWFDDPMRSLPALHALLRPGGWLAFATLGPASLAAWRDAHVAEGLTPPTQDFPDPAALAEAWPGRSDRRIERLAVAVAHSGGRAFLAGLRAIGAHTPRLNHTRLHPGQLRRVLARFERDHAATAQYEVALLCLRQ